MLAVAEEWNDGADRVGGADEKRALNWRVANSSALLAHFEKQLERIRINRIDAAPLIEHVEHGTDPSRFSVLADTDCFHEAFL